MVNGKKFVLSCQVRNTTNFDINAKLALSVLASKSDKGGASRKGQGSVICLDGRQLEMISRFFCVCFYNPFYIQLKAVRETWGERYGYQNERAILLLFSVWDNNTLKSSLMPNVFMRLVGLERRFCFDFAFTVTSR